MRGAHETSVASVESVPHEKPPCALCGARAAEPLYETRDRLYGIRGTFAVVRCRECGLVFQDPILTPEALRDLYPTDYYAYQDPDPEPEGGLTLRLRAALGLTVHTIEPRFEAPGRMLDIGCGAGEFLLQMRAQGWDARGVEINEDAARLARERHGLDVVGGTLQHASYEAASFDYVRANHSFEHMSDPNAVLDEIMRILKPDGTFLIGVPNIGGLNARLFGRYWWHLAIPVHTFAYSAKTLPRLLTKHGFTVERLTYNGDFSGILGSAQIFADRHAERRAGNGKLVNSRPLQGLAQGLAKLQNLLHVADVIEVTCRRPPGADQPRPQ